MNVTVIATVLNEGESIKNLMDSLAAQTRLPDEVVIVDGGSRDNTVAVIQRYAKRLPVQVIVSEGANISQGRNIAIQSATGPVIASTDAGVRLAANWLAELLAPFDSPETPQVVSGFFEADPQTTFEVAMGATALPMLDDITPDTFLPSSRSIAFTKSAWKAAGGYPEWLDFCEDLIFDLNLKDYAGHFAFAPQAVAHFRPRGSLGAFFKQYYQYARGDGKADLWRKRHAIRYLTYLLALPMLILLGALFSPWWWLAGGIIGAWGLFYTPYKRLFHSWSKLIWLQKAKALLWIPVIRLTGDLAKMVGYPVGLYWRWQRLSNEPQLRWRREQGSRREGE
ncbi:MAG TPA: glycosyltransferase [Chloroflexi bacterium]|nr:glycosyltransferase [Chloroflexota bacterium]